MTAPTASDDRPAPEQASGATDILAGLLFAVIGVTALYLSRAYPFGTALRMGPGFLPRIVAAVLVLIGVASILRGLFIGGWRPPEIVWRPVLLISVAVLSFALTIDRFGLIVASILAVVISGCAESAVRWRELPLIAVGLAAFCAVLFGYILGISMPVWPQ